MQREPLVGGCDPRTALPVEPQSGQDGADHRRAFIDLALDIRKGSPTLGKIIAYDLPASPGAAFGQWIWLPPGFAHCACMLRSRRSSISVPRNGPPETRRASPRWPPISTGRCAEPALKAQYDRTLASAILSPKDRDGFSLAGWCNDPRSEHFVYGEC